MKYWASTSPEQREEDAKKAKEKEQKAAFEAKIRRTQKEFASKTKVTSETLKSGLLIGSGDQI